MNPCTTCSDKVRLPTARELRSLAAYHEQSVGDTTVIGPRLAKLAAWFDEFDGALAVEVYEASMDRDSPGLWTVYQFLLQVQKARG